MAGARCLKCGAEVGQGDPDAFWECYCCTCYNDLCRNESAAVALLGEIAHKPFVADQLDGETWDRIKEVARLK